VLASGLLVVHDTSGGGEDNITKLTGWQELDNPFLKVCKAHIVTWRDDTSLVETTVQLDDDLAGSVVINFFELANVTVLLHDTEELDDNLGGRADEDLSLSRLLSVVDGVERIVEDGGLDHFCGSRFSSLEFEVRYLQKLYVSLHGL